jgi:site-specific recombinase XerD
MRIYAERSRSVAFTRLTEGFKEWLSILGYSNDTVASQPRVIEKYFAFMEASKIKRLGEIKLTDTRNWYESEKRRKSKQTGELLKNSTLNGIIRSLKLFSQYLDETSQGTLTIDLPYEPKEIPERDILTQEEIKAIYNAADESILGLRDRAILSLYYGCGLRSKEGQYLELSDIILDRKLVYVRKGKQYKERYVPFVGNQMTDFKFYLKECRPELMQENTKNWFLLNNKGNQTDSSFLLKRIKHLSKAAGINKNIGMHTLRHSIATHLLQSGMKLESISQFLGHKNIQSTQRYTHIVGKDEGL